MKIMGVGMRPKRTTITSVVESVMSELDEPVVVSDLVYLTGASINNITAALCHFREYGVVDAIDVGSQRWWYLTGVDNRIRTMETRAEELVPRRRQRVKRGVSQITVRTKHRETVAVHAGAVRTLLNEFEK